MVLVSYSGMERVVKEVLLYGVYRDIFTREPVDGSGPYQLGRPIAELVVQCALAQRWVFEFFHRLVVVQYIECA